MTDRGTVINVLNAAIDTAFAANCELAKVPVDVAVHAVDMLKEQEPVKPYSQGDDSFGCGNCGGVVGWDELACSGSESVKYKYCPECGKAVLWDE